MKNIRLNIFETNSSSSHSFSCGEGNISLYVIQYIFENLIEDAYNCNYKTCDELYDDIKRRIDDLTQEKFNDTQLAYNNYEI